MCKTLTLGSLFDGSGGFPLGGLLAGITPVWASEIEPFPIRVTTKRLPQMKHYGNISKMNGGEIPLVDIITFGSPCQDMSVAGKRKGLDGSRSSLFYEAIRIIKEMREATNGKKPRFIVWENVPGAFSSNKGEDFRAVLEEVCKIKDECVSVPKPSKWQSAGKILGDGYSVAWRQLDAQYWGVPQRRKRIYLVADFAGGSAGKILFESEGLSGYSAEGFRAWQRTAENPEKDTGTAGGENERLVLCDQGGNRMDVLKDKVATIRAEAHHPPIVMESAGFCTEHSAKSRSIGYEEETSPTLRAGVVPAALAVENHPTDSRVKLSEDGVVQTITERCGTGGGNVPLLMEQKVFGVCSKNSNSMKSDNPNSGFYEAETTRTLDANGGHPNCNQGGMAVVCVDQGSGVNEDVSFTLDGADHHAVAAPVWSTSKNSHHTCAEADPVNTLVATDYKDPPTVTEYPYYIVRRLTPTECARLQGFPDWWCENLNTENPTEEDISYWKKVFSDYAIAIGKKVKPKTNNQIAKWLKNPNSDTAEYKMWGNGVALPNVVFVLQGITYCVKNKKGKDCYD